jgi:aminocarboxymuconate-semialdehyde decarboxylase
MKIDIFPHIMPQKYFEALKKKSALTGKVTDISPWADFPPLSDVALRLKALERTPDVVQVLTLSAPPVETIVSPKDAVELSRIANEEMAALVTKYPDRFLAAAACLPLNDPDASAKELERAVTQLGMKGAQLFSNINGEMLDARKFWPIYEVAAKYDVALWLHPWDQPGAPRVNPLNWPYETSTAMIRLAFSGVLKDYPDIKFIAHHCGAMIPFFEERIRWLGGSFVMEGKRIDNPLEYLHKFYADTALYGGTPALMLGYTFFGTDHLLFGTDAPLGGRMTVGNEREILGHTLDTVKAIEKMDIPAKDKKKIFSENARRILRLR